MDSFKKFSGQYRYHHIPVLKLTDSALAETDHEKAKAFATRFHSVSATENYSSVFLPNKQQLTLFLQLQLTNRNHIFRRDNRINKSLKSFEFDIVIKNAKNTSPGGDRVCYKMFKHLPCFLL